MCCEGQAPSTSRYILSAIAFVWRRPCDWHVPCDFIPSLTLENPLLRGMSEVNQSKQRLRLLHECQIRCNYSTAPAHVNTYKYVFLRLYGDFFCRSDSRSQRAQSVFEQPRQPSFHGLVDGRVRGEDLGVALSHGHEAIALRRRKILRLYTDPIRRTQLLLRAACRSDPVAS